MAGPRKSRLQRGDPRCPTGNVDADWQQARPAYRKTGLYPRRDAAHATDLSGLYVVAEIQKWLGEIPDPEIPVLSILDLGIVRDVKESASGAVTVIVTPTYSGCPAMDVIREDIHAVLHAHGVAEVNVETV